MMIDNDGSNSDDDDDDGDGDGSNSAAATRRSYRAWSQQGLTCRRACVEATTATVFLIEQILIKRLI